jgi:NNP family nitrate/nitrite transporter-like MFS transporter
MLNRDAKDQSGTIRAELSPLLFFTAIFLINFIARVILSPLMPTVEKDLALSHTDAGSLFLFISSGYVLGLLGGGFIAYYLTHRINIIASAVIIGLALEAIALSSGMWGIQIGLVVVGIGSGIYLPSGIASITNLIKTQHWGKALAVHELAPNLGFLSAPLISEMLLPLVSWRGVLAILGIVSLLLSLAFALFGRGGKFRGEAPSFMSYRLLLSVPSFWVMVGLFILGVGATLGLYTMLPLFLVTVHGIDRSLANAVVSLSRLPGVGMVFLSGWGCDRFGSKQTLILVFLIGGCLTILLGTVPSSWIIIIVFLHPWIAACFFPAGFAALSSIGPPGSRHVAVSLTLPVSTLLAGGVIPTGIGFMGDVGLFGMGIALFGGLMLLGLIPLRYLNINNG